MRILYSKILRNLTFVVQLAYFCITPKNGKEQRFSFHFLLTFEQLSLQGATFGEINRGQLSENLEQPKENPTH